MKGALAELWRLLSEQSVRTLVIAFALTVSAVDVLRGAVYALAYWPGDSFFGWRYYLGPLVVDLVVFVLVVIASALFLVLSGRKSVRPTVGHE